MMECIGILPLPDYKELTIAYFPSNDYISLRIFDYSAVGANRDLYTTFALDDEGKQSLINFIKDELNGI